MNKVTLSFMPTEGYKSINENVLPLNKGVYSLVPLNASEKSKDKGKASVQVRVLNVDGTAPIDGADTKTWLDAMFVGVKKVGDGAEFYSSYTAEFAVGAGFVKCTPNMTAEEKAEAKAQAEADKKASKKKK